MEIDKKIIRSALNMDGQTILTENQIKYILSKNNKLSAVMNTLNKSKMENDGSSSSSTTSTTLPINELGKMLLNYSKEGNAEKILKLIQEGAPFISDWLGMSALHFSAMNNHRDVLELLLKSGLNKDTRTKVDRTALHLAAYHGHLSIVDLLLKVDCDVNAKDMLRMTPLHWAVERGHTEVARLLSRHGADVDAISKFEKTPLSIAIQNGQTELLKDLQTAREQMRNKPPVPDQIQNETNAAVSSIMPDNVDEDLFDVDDDGDIKVKNLKSEMLDENSKEDMLKKLKSMMSIDDADDTLLTSALQNGRQLVLSEGGRLALNDAKSRHVPHNLVNTNNHRKHMEDDKHKKQFIFKPKSVPLKPPGKNVKILSIDAFKKIYGQNALNSIQNQNLIHSGLSKSNVRHGPLHLTKVTRVANMSELNGKKAIFNPVASSNGSNSISHTNRPTYNTTSAKPKIEERDDDLSSIIEICTENDSDQEMEDQVSPANHRSNSIGNYKQRLDSVSSNGSLKQSYSLNNGKILGNSLSTPVKSSFQTNSSTITTATSATATTIRSSNVVQLLDIPEICRQLQEQRRNNEVLRREIELIRIENEEYKMRLERLECKIDEQELRLS